MRPMALRPTVMQLDNTKGAPNLSINPFQVMRIMEGMRITMMLARRLRHWVVRSARTRLEKTDDAGVSLMAGATGLAVAGVAGEGNVDDISLAFMVIIYDLMASPVRPIKTSSRVTRPLRDARMTSGLSRLSSMMACGGSVVMIWPWSMMAMRSQMDSASSMEWGVRGAACALG